MFSANEIPGSSDTSPGWRRRWEVFSFPNTFAHDPRPGAGAAPAGRAGRDRRAGVRALRELMARTPPEFTRTAAGDAAKAEFVAHQDPLHGWMTECCWVLDGQRCWTDRRNAYSSYRDVVRDSGGTRYPLGKLKFYALCKERFGETVHRGWPGYPGLWLMNGTRKGRAPQRGSFCPGRWRPAKATHVCAGQSCGGEKVSFHPYLPSCARA